ncbi:MAG: glycosyltransferase family 4 protein [Acidilobaceae archaeon]|nr:glycosyltransferase family 4 protein [Acidilobaceae archaeon]MCX8165180.1 glycosyltransferase family 4 protein [Acidilobaceae archaeon]MDW7974304.1 glycosyltransferase family 4 protein [Sulfolobales archaeon]
MRIAFVTDSYKPKIGGIESAVRNIAYTLAEEHEVFVITSARKIGGYRVEEDGPVRVVRVDSGRLYYKGVTLNPLSALTLTKALKELKPDVVHGHGLFSTLSLIGVLAARRLKRPSLLTAHSFIGRDTPRYVVGTLRLLLQRVDLVTAVSKAVAEEVYKRLRPREIFVTYNCVRMEEWSREEPLELPGDPVVVSVIRLVPRKNPLALLKVAERMKREAPGGVLYIVGDGVLRKPLERRAQARGLNNLVFLGAASGESLRRVLAASHLFVLPTKLEAFGLSALEAMAMGMPVVAMQSGGVAELVEDGISGLLARDEEELAALTARLASDSVALKVMGERARERAQLFDCSRVVRMYLDAYEKALQLRCWGKRLESSVDI